ncbi:MAG TPA: S41 family peptidase [Saprospiraceae bacterium]|nr:S41 family peptidase [Saprospiraceae bacterium]
MKKIVYLICLGLIGFAFTACEDAFFQDEPVNNPEAVFENLWKVFNEDYGPTKERNVNWDALYAAYRPQVTATTTDDELFSIISSMLGTLNDGHVNLIAPNRDDFNSNFILNNEIGDSLFNLENIKANYLDPGFAFGEEDAYVYGKIKGENIGYIYFDYVGDNFFELNTFLDASKDTKGIIIDMRHNQGGDFTYCYSECGRLVDQRHLAFSSRTKTGTGRDDFSEWKEWYVEPAGEYFDKPIVVLIDRYTISAGERSVMAFMTLPNVTMIGDTTCGAHATIVGRELANGWYTSIPIQNTLLPDGKTYEGVGLIPDIRFINVIEDVRQGLDKTLEKAIDEL